jgi:hypothetical protein
MDAGGEINTAVGNSTVGGAAAGATAWITIAPINATSNISNQIIVNKVGKYTAQCRPCKDTVCAPYEGGF